MLLLLALHMGSMLSTCMLFILPFSWACSLECHVCGVSEPDPIFRWVHKREEDIGYHRRRQIDLSGSPETALVAPPPHRAARLCLRIAYRSPASESARPRVKWRPSLAAGRRACSSPARRPAFRCQQCPDVSAAREGSRECCRQPRRLRTCRGAHWRNPACVCRQRAGLPATAVRCVAGRSGIAGVCTNVKLSVVCEYAWARRAAVSLMSAVAGALWTASRTADQTDQPPASVAPSPLNRCAFFCLYSCTH